MVIKTKFNIGDKVYFWNIKEARIGKGVITAISTYSNSENCIVKTDKNYYIKDSLDSISLPCQIPEHLIFYNREDVFEFCMELTKDI